LPPDKFIKEGDKIKFGKESLKVIETPGHTPGSISFYSPGFLFSGDLIFAEGVGRTDFPYSSESQLFSSIGKIRKFLKKAIVYPGHGNKFGGDEINIKYA
jgi:glyoxylase-like metal-dependent hydrolase (beta-lactamase superfamily II)